MNDRVETVRRAMIATVSTLAFAALATSTAQAVDRDFGASPEVYKVVAQDDQYRVVEGTWKPGQRDAFHSHPWVLYYWVTDCSLRFHLPDGTSRDDAVTAGRAGAQPPIASHSVENIGKAECKVVMFESK